MQIPPEFKKPKFGKSDKLTRVRNFLIQSENARLLPLDCPPGFRQYQDTCEQEERSPESPEAVREYFEKWVEDEDANATTD